MSRTWEQDVRACEEENRAAFLAGDLAVLDRLWTDDFLVNSPHNVVGDKRRTLALLEAGRIRHASVTCEIEHMACHGDVLSVVMGRDEVTDPPTARLASTLHRPVAPRRRQMALLRADTPTSSRGSRRPYEGRTGAHAR